MKINNILKFKILYIFFVFLSLNLFFFSTAKSNTKSFGIENIEISEPFEMNFDKNKVIDKGFQVAFKQLTLKIINSSDQKKLGLLKLNEIKGMIESFNIREEKFINEIYYLTLGVSFNKRKIFDYFESKNIFPSIPKKNKFLFLPIIIDERKKDLLIFNDNDFFNSWNNDNESYHLIEYIIPTEDLEDLEIIKKNYEIIEKYDFSKIIDKYYLKDSIILLVFKNENGTRILSRITNNNDVIIKNHSFPELSIEKKEDINIIIIKLKNYYEDYWKNINQINTSIKLILNVKVEASKNENIRRFEKSLQEIDFIYDFYITKFDKDYVNYKLIYNGTPSDFLKKMKNKNHNFNTQNREWILK